PAPAHSRVMPVVARTSGPYPIRALHGPTAPNALLSASITRGLSDRSESYGKPSDARVPGLKLANTASAPRTNRANSAAPAGRRRSSPRLLSLRWVSAHDRLIT